MAEYFPLLDRAVSGLTEPTAEARRSIYERARAALLGQLRRMDPPVPEDDIARESAALDEAIARVEARFADHGGAPGAEARATDSLATRTPAPQAPAPQAPASQAPASQAPAVEVPAAAPLPAAAPARVPPPPLPTGAPPVVPPPSRERPVLGPRPTAGGSAAPAPAMAPTVAPAVAPPRPALGPAVRAPLPPRGTRPVMALRPVAPAPVRARDGVPARPAEPGSAADTPATAAAAPAEVAVSPSTELPEAPVGSGFTAALDAAALDAAVSDVTTSDAAFGEASASQADGIARGSARDSGPAASAAVPVAARPRDGGARPPAPRPREAARWNRPAIAGALVAVVVAMAGMGFAAYRLRDRPDQVVAARSAAADATGTAAAGTGGTAAGKMAERAAPADADPQPTSGASVPAPLPQSLDGGAAPSIAVAQRAALLVDAPDDPQRVRTYVGTVVWHLDSVSPGGGQPLASAVKADVDIPDAKLKVTMLMQKNPEPQLPASHTVEFHFLPQPGNVLGPVKQVNVPEMRRDDDAPTGDPLAGVPVAITDNYFLVGLTRGAAEKDNLRLIADRNWFDMSVLFTSGKLGKLTFEKGAGGQRVIDDALKAWK